MEKNGKRYGYTVALWEMGTTVPTLFRKVSDYKKSMQIPTTSLWTAMMDPSYLPWPIRSLLSWSRNRDEHGDLWNMCHFWSNFEIADMDFFRSDAYRHFFEYLDADGGFYYERVCNLVCTSCHFTNLPSGAMRPSTRSQLRSF